MAHEQDVKKYLAYWFQLGKKVVMGNTKTLRPEKVVEGDHYSDEFEDCWQKIISPDTGECYLEGTHETIEELLTPAWDMSPCARCSMLIPVKNVGMPPLACPCFDLTNWPNTELPPPRGPINSREQLMSIRARLLSD
jgi:hypothetical protein